MDSVSASLTDLKKKGVFQKKVKMKKVQEFRKLAVFLHKQFGGIPLERKVRTKHNENFL